MKKTIKTYTFLCFKISIEREAKKEKFLLLCKYNGIVCDNDLTPMITWGTSIQDVKDNWKYKGIWPIFHVIPFRVIPHNEKKDFLHLQNI